MTMMQQLLIVQIPSKPDRLSKDRDLLSLFHQRIAAQPSFVRETSNTECNDDQKV